MFYFYEESLYFVLVLSDDWLCSISFLLRLLDSISLAFPLHMNGLSLLTSDSFTGLSKNSSAPSSKHLIHKTKTKTQFRLHMIFLVYPFQILIWLKNGSCSSRLCWNVFVIRPNSWPDKENPFLTSRENSLWNNDLLTVETN